MLDVCKLLVWITLSKYISTELSLRDMAASITLPYPCQMVHLDGLYSASLFFTSPANNSKMVDCTVTISLPYRNHLVNISVESLEMISKVESSQCIDYVRAFDSDKSITGFRQSLCGNGTFQRHWVLFRTSSLGFAYKKHFPVKSSLNIAFRIVPDGYHDSFDRNEKSNKGSNNLTISNPPTATNQTLQNSSCTTVIPTERLIIISLIHLLMVTRI